jgi:hypothetical protein
MDAPIQRNSDGIPIIELFNNERKKVAETKVDEVETVRHILQISKTYPVLETQI